METSLIIVACMAFFGLIACGLSRYVLTFTILIFVIYATFILALAL